MRPGGSQWRDGSAVSSPSRGERLLLVLTPAVAMAAVAVGLRLGARGGSRAAIVYGAPASRAGKLAWQIVVFDEDQGAREPVAGLDVAVLARAGDASAQWHGVTDADGVAEAQLGLLDATGVSLEVRSGPAVLARGDAAAPPWRSEAPADDPAQTRARTQTQTGWLRFARREGAIVLDVAALGQRVAPGFPAELWVHATDATSRSPVGGVTVALDDDTSLDPGGASPDASSRSAEGGAGPGGGAPAATPAGGRADSRGWVRIVAVPVGLAVTVTLHARAPDGRSGEWIGGLFMSPGAPDLDVPRRIEPGAAIPIGVTMPTVRSTAYLEIDDARGRAWAATPALAPEPDGRSAVRSQAPALPPGLYWAVAAADPAAASTLTSGTLARPFFVASSDEAALALGSDRAACTPPRDVRETASAVSSCLALSAITPAPRWIALDGFVMQAAQGREARARGLAVALGALAVAIVLEATLLMRAAAGSRARTVAVAILVGLLGLALLAAFIVRV
jgi:hypothetical protein